LSISEIPTHTHTASASPTAATKATIPGNILASAPVYGPANNLTSLLPNTIGSVGGSQAHLNMQPFLVLNFSIALQGIFPSQT
jgi:microcystin-dependent protein